MSIDRMAGNGGTYFLESTTAHTGKLFSMIYVASDAVFTTLTQTNRGASGSDTTSNALTGQNLSGRTVPAGTTLCAPQGSWFSAITMSSGSAVGIITNRQ